MFTGLVEEVGIARDFRPHDGGFLVSVECHEILEDLKAGDSISVNGACLTVVDVWSNGFSAHVSRETHERTNLRWVRPGSPLNLERALRMDSRLGGHLVTGHVDGVGVVREVRKRGEYLEIGFRCPPEVRKYLVPKGSVAVNGVSLTVNAVDEEGFFVALIPHTLKETNLSRLRVGDPVNLEADILGKYVFRYLDTKGSQDQEMGNEDEALMRKLQEGGFVF